MSCFAQKKRSSSIRQSQKVENSAKQSDWSKVFPQKISNCNQSTTFVKKLLRSSISNIVYLRNIFEEDAFADKSLSGLKLKILKEKSGNEKAETFASWLVGAFDAIERNYLRELVFFIYLDEDKPEDVHEKYTYKFNYNDGEAEIEMTGDDKVGGKQSMDMKSIQETTRALLRSILVTTQALQPLPDSAYLAIKLTYYDEVTPKDYEPVGFVASNLTEEMPKERLSTDLGSVETSYHTVKLKVDAKISKVKVDDSVINNKFMEASNEMSQTQSQAKISCVCNNQTEDPVMLTCSRCGCVEHGVCYRIISRDQVPSHHVCLSCADETHPCTDTKLVKIKMSQSNNASITCLFRRILVAMIDLETIPENWIEERFAKSSRSVLDGISKKLVQANVLQGKVKGTYVIKKEALRTQVKRYLGDKNQIKTDLKDLVSKTGDINLDAKTRKRSLVEEDQTRLDDDFKDKQESSEEFSRLVSKKTKMTKKSRSSIIMK